MKVAWPLSETQECLSALIVKNAIAKKSSTVLLPDNCEAHDWILCNHSICLSIPAACRSLIPSVFEIVLDLEAAHVRWVSCKKFLTFILTHTRELNDVPLKVFCFVSYRLHTYQDHSVAECRYFSQYSDLQHDSNGSFLFILRSFRPNHWHCVRFHHFLPKFPTCGNIL